MVMHGFSQRRERARVARASAICGRHRRVPRAKDPGGPGHRAHQDEGGGSGTAERVRLDRSQGRDRPHSGRPGDRHPGRVGLTGDSQPLRPAMEERLDSRGGLPRHAMRSHDPTPGTGAEAMTIQTADALRGRRWRSWARIAGLESPVRRTAGLRGCREPGGVRPGARAKLPLELHFRDESGRELPWVTLRRRPVILAPVYYGCPLLCGQVLAGCTGAQAAVARGRQGFRRHRVQHRPAMKRLRWRCRRRRHISSGTTARGASRAGIS